MPQMFEQIEDAAMAFCQECLGWGEVGIIDGYESQPYSSVVSEGRSSFYYEDLNTVMDAVYTWADDLHRSWLTISLKPTTGWKEWKVEFYDASITHYSLCHALLEACVEANRKVGRTKGRNDREEV